MQAPRGWKVQSGCSAGWAGAGGEIVTVVTFSWGAMFYLVFALVWRREPLMPRQGSPFLLLRQKKGAKEKATLLAATRSVAAGNLRRGAVGVRRRTRCALRAALRQLQRVRSRSRCCRTRHSGHPASAPSQAHPEGRGETHGPSLRSALQSQHPPIHARVQAGGAGVRAQAPFAAPCSAQSASIPGEHIDSTARQSARA